MLFKTGWGPHLEVSAIKLQHWDLRTLGLGTTVFDSIHSVSSNSWLWSPSSACYQMAHYNSGSHAIVLQSGYYPLWAVILLYNNDGLML